MANLPYKFIKSFAYALRGMAQLFKSQPNARIELICAFMAIFCAIIFKIDFYEWLAILLCIALVLGLEGINTAVELLADKVHPGFDTEIGKAKDVAAAAVLIASVVAFIIGFIIFVPKFINLFTN